jgi:hypothetical protein
MFIPQSVYAFSFSSLKIQQERSHLQARNHLHQNLTSTTVRDTLLFLKDPVCGILWWQPELTYRHKQSFETSIFYLFFVSVLCFSGHILDLFFHFEVLPKFGSLLTSEDEEQMHFSSLYVCVQSFSFFLYLANNFYPELISYLKYLFKLNT